MATATRTDMTQAVHKEVGSRPREAAKIASRRVVVFRASAKLKTQINDARAVCGQDAQASPRSSLSARLKAPTAGSCRVRCDIHRCSRHFDHIGQWNNARVSTLSCRVRCCFHKSLTPF